MVANPMFVMQIPTHQYRPVNDVLTERTQKWHNLPESANRPRIASPRNPAARAPHCVTGNIRDNMQEVQDGGN